MVGSYPPAGAGKVPVFQLAMLYHHMQIKIPEENEMFFDQSFDPLINMMQLLLHQTLLCQAVNTTQPFSTRQAEVPHIEWLTRSQIC